MRRHLTVLWILLAVLWQPVRAAEMPRYSVVFDAQTQQARVQVCLSEAHGEVAFAADSGWAMRFVGDVRRGGGRELDQGGDGWNAHTWQAGECLSYRADIGAIAAQHKQDIGWKLGDDLVAAPQLWLLRVEDEDGDGAEVAVKLPAGWSISAPWHELGRDGESIRFHIPHTPPDWSAAVAFGHFEEERIGLPGGQLRLVALHGIDARQREKLRTWLARVSRAVLSAYGRLPLADVQVLMIPVTSHHGEAVVFGQSVRGQGNALQLLVDPSRPEAEFDKSWVAVHELSHLMHPYLGDRGSWLAEGLATYYQNVLRGRAGLLTPAQAWDRLREGFADAAQSDNDDTLEQAAAKMYKTHTFRRIYWSGAAYWLTVDRDLRRSSDGKLSMELALSRFRDCCLPAYRDWRPEEFVAKLDALLGVQTFSVRYREFAAMKPFPDWRKLYADLGIHDDDGAHLQFDAAAPGAKVREAIMAPR
jgi:M61 glycyl aminopeptidase